MRMRAVMMVSALFACGKSEKAPPPKEAETEKAIEITRQPLAAVASHAGGLDFTIELPPSASLPVVNGQFPKVSWKFKESKLELEVNASGTAMLEPDGSPLPTEVGKVDINVMTEPDAWVRLTRYKDQTAFSQTTCRNIKYGSVCCTMSLRHPTKVDLVDDVIAWAERVCRTIKQTN